MTALSGLFYGIQKMANTDIKWFSFDNLNAPQLSNTWGCMIDLLDACLVTGFGAQAVVNIVISDGVGIATFNNSHSIKQFQVVEFSGASEPALNSEFKVLGLTANTIEFLIDLPDQTVTGAISCKLAPLGWTKAFSGTQKAVYQAKDTVSNPYYLRVDNSRDPVYTDTYAKFAKVGILESCAGIDDISGNQAPFDPALPTKNWIGTGSGSGAVVGWFKWQYAVNENSATQGNYYESEGAANGNRTWILVGTKDSFYLINKATVNTILEIPYGFGVIQHNEVAKPFLFAVNRYASANSSVISATSLGDPSKVGVAAMYDYVGSKVNDKFSKALSGFGNIISGSAGNVVKTDPVRGYVLTNLYLVDPDNFILDAFPLVRFCVNNATTAANFDLFFDGEKIYIASRFRTGAGGQIGTLFFKIYDGAE